MANVLNLTPHDVCIVDADGAVTHTFKRTGMVARVECLPGQVRKPIGGIEVQSAPTYGVVESLRYSISWAKVDAVIVSMVVGEAHRRNASNFPAYVRVLAPDTSPESVRRDANGQPIGVRRLVEYEATGGQ